MPLTSVMNSRRFILGLDTCRLTLACYNLPGCECWEKCRVEPKADISTAKLKIIDVFICKLVGRNKRSALRRIRVAASVVSPRRAGWDGFRKIGGRHLSTAAWASRVWRGTGAMRSAYCALRTRHLFSSRLQLIRFDQDFRRHFPRLADLVDHLNGQG